MRLRELEAKDIPYILEWMKDPKISVFFQYNRDLIDKNSVSAFIDKAHSSKNERHFACVDEADQYLGTISLKHIDEKNRTAEYAVGFRATAHGTGAAVFATDAILSIAFGELLLHKVYLNVLASNKRAIRFYEKAGFTLEGVARQHLYLQGSFQDLCWFSILDEEWERL